MVIFFNKKIIQLESIEYTGTVFVLDHKYPEQLINHSIKKLEKFGIKKEDMKITDSPDDPKIGSIVVEVFHTTQKLHVLGQLEMLHLSVAL